MGHITLSCHTSPGPARQLLTDIPSGADPLAKVAEVAEAASAKVKELFTDDNILDYCSLDERVRLSEDALIRAH